MTKEEMILKLDVILDEIDARLCDPNLDAESYEFERKIYDALFEITYSR